MPIKEIDPDSLDPVHLNDGGASETTEINPSLVQSTGDDAWYDPIGDAVYSLSGGALRGAANILGLPAKLANEAAFAVGAGDLLGASHTPIGSPLSLKEGIEALGGPAVGEELPYPVLGRVGQEIGAATIPFGAFGAAARGARAGEGLLGPILTSFRATPVRNAAGELVSAAGAGAGAAIASKAFPDSDEAEIIGQLLGGFATPLTLSAPRVFNAPVVRNIPPLGTARRMGRFARSFTPTGARLNAAKQIQKVAGDEAEDAARILSGEKMGVEGAQLTPAQETQNPGLMRVERAFVAENPEMEDAIAARNLATREAVARDAEGIATDSDSATRDFLESRVEAVQASIKDRVETAMRNAQRRLAKLGTNDKGEASAVVRDELDGALGDMKDREKALWSEVDSEAVAPTGGLKSEFESIMSGRNKADDPEDIPSYLESMVGEEGSLSGAEPVNTLQSLRSRLLQDIRNERAKDAPNRRKVAVMERMQRATLGAMEEARGAGDDLQVALTFSKDLNQRFRQGPVGQILGFERRGGLKKAPELTLEGLLSPNGEKSAVNMATLEQAFQNMPERAERFHNAAKSFIKARFTMEATDPSTGKVSVQSANRFIRNNQKLMDNYPELKRQIQDATKAQHLTDSVQKSGALRSQNLVDRKKAKAALFLDAPPGQEIDRVLRSRSPAKNLKGLVSQVKKDPSGQALEGLRHQMVDRIMKSAQGANPGQSVNKFLFDNAASIRTSGLFTDAQLKRIYKIADTLSLMDIGRVKERGVSGLIDAKPDAVIDLVSRIVGANLGAMGAASHTGSTLVAAEAGSRLMRKLTENIPLGRTRDVISSAVLDRDLMRELLVGRTERLARNKALRRRPNAWMANILAPGEREEREDQSGVVDVDPALIQSSP